MRNVISYIWQLPQNILGLLLRLKYKGCNSIYEDAIVRRSTAMVGGISLGRYIIVSQWANKKTIMHEYGHCRQSKMLGWLYLPIVGLQSLIWAGLYGSVIKTSPNGYYEFWTVSWADKLGKVKR